MYIRRTKTNTSSSGEPYYTYRLVASERQGDKVRQRTILNLGKNFAVPKDEWGQLCARIQDVLHGQPLLLECSVELEELAQTYAAQILSSRTYQVVSEDHQDTHPSYHEVDVNSIELLRPRSIGVEHVGLQALKKLELPQILSSVGLSGVQQAMVMGSIIARMAQPGSERSTRTWLSHHSGLGELLGIEYNKRSAVSWYRLSDRLVSHRREIESALFGRIQDLFALPSVITLYDLTNTYFEGQMRQQNQARHGRSKEKRSDCPLVTLALALDESGFIRCSRTFAGNVSEVTTLETMLRELNAQPQTLVVMDRGIASQANLTWLHEQNYRYLVVSREQQRQFNATPSITIETAQQQPVQIQRVVDEQAQEVRLYCHSIQRQVKEKALTDSIAQRFEQALQALVKTIHQPHRTTPSNKVHEKLGRLKQQHQGVWQHYQIDVLLDDTNTNVIDLKWERKPINGTRVTHPGVYCLRTNELTWDAQTLWRTYSMLTDLEAVFRSLKSELGLRPIFHQTHKRTDAHLFISVLAYQVVQVIRTQLKAAGINSSWSTLRKLFAQQQRITVSFKQRDGRFLHVRKSTLPEPQLKKLYELLNLSQTPGGIQKTIV